MFFKGKYMLSKTGPGRRISWNKNLRKTAPAEEENPYKVAIISSL